MAKDYSRCVDIYEPELSEFESTVEGVLRRQKQLRFWKDGSQWFIWCDQCRQWEPIDKRAKQMVNDCHVCPMCFRNADGIKLTCDLKVNQPIMLTENHGFWVSWSLKNGVLKINSARQVAYWCGDKEYVRNIVRTMNGCIGWMDRDNWRLVRPGWYNKWKYWDCFYHAADFDDGDLWGYYIASKKDYYRFIAQLIPLKSDQVKFISQGLYNQDQLEYIRAFDLHDPKQVHKYASYMKTYRAIETDNFNVHTLDYLWRNRIPLSDYRDYVGWCQLLGRKADKPTDFWHWHDEIMKAVEVKKDQATEQAILMRAAKLPAYVNKKTAIRPIESIRHLTEVSQALHNCIRTYAERYSKGETDLYCMTIDDKIVGALEIRKNKLEQARADHNAVLPPIAMQTVHQFCTQIGVTWR